METTSISIYLGFVMVMMGLAVEGQGGLKTGFYSSSCPKAEDVVRSTVEAHFNKDPSVAAGLLRLHFHDCFVQGCDGSVLIKGASAERNALPNLGLRGFEVIDDAKSQLESTCPGVVSCADILALAARDSVNLSDGPRWNVPTGRRDGRISLSAQVSNLPSPFDSVDAQRQKFSAKGLDDHDLVTLVGTFFLLSSILKLAKNIHIVVQQLNQYIHRAAISVTPSYTESQDQTNTIQRFIKSSIKSLTELNETLNRSRSAHTIGQTHCQFVSYRLYNFTTTGNADPTISPAFLTRLQTLCPNNGDGSKGVALDIDSQQKFDVSFFKKVRDGNAILESDQRLWGDSETQRIVKNYAGSIRGLLGFRFDFEFQKAMIKMSSIEVKTGTQGEIRKICSKFN